MLKAWLRRPDMLPLRGGWQATDFYPAKSGTSHVIF